ncbi:transposase [Colwellia sp. MB02u-6]|jgi:transposase-like protein|nr:transposase [Colwellia sp. MB02u-6]MBA6328070.1 transposase [Colwellia sp. MB02u-6]
MTKRTKPNFTAKFRLECAQLVLDKKYVIIKVAQVMNVGNSSLDKWVHQLKMNVMASRVKRCYKRQINLKFVNLKNVLLALNNKEYELSSLLAS